MKMSTKGRYGIIIMIDLAKAGDYLSIHDIAEKEDMSEKYLGKIISLLIKAKLVTSSHGKNGGYKLTKEPKDYTVGEILRVLEGDMAPAPCVKDNKCDKIDTCEMYSFWNGLYNNINNYVDDKTLDELL